MAARKLFAMPSYICFNFSMFSHLREWSHRRIQLGSMKTILPIESACRVVKVDHFPSENNISDSGFFRLGISSNEAFQYLKVWKILNSNLNFPNLTQFAQGCSPSSVTVCSAAVLSVFHPGLSRIDCLFGGLFLFPLHCKPILLLIDLDIDEILHNLLRKGNYYEVKIGSGLKHCFC